MRLINGPQLAFIMRISGQNVEHYTDLSGLKVNQFPRVFFFFYYC